MREEGSQRLEEMVHALTTLPLGPDVVLSLRQWPLRLAVRHLHREARCFRAYSELRRARGRAHRLPLPGRRRRQARCSRWTHWGWGWRWSWRWRRRWRLGDARCRHCCHCGTHCRQRRRGPRSRGLAMGCRWVAIGGFEVARWGVDGRGSDGMSGFGAPRFQAWGGEFHDARWIHVVRSTRERHDSTRSARFSVDRENVLLDGGLQGDLGVHGRPPRFGLVIRERVDAARVNLQAIVRAPHRHLRRLLEIV